VGEAIDNGTAHFRVVGHSCSEWVREGEVSGVIPTQHRAEDFVRGEQDLWAWGPGEDRVVGHGEGGGKVLSCYRAMHK
jgi:hypothetical protein